jgi:hypothetical protein
LWLTVFIQPDRTLNTNNGSIPHNGHKSPIGAVDGAIVPWVNRAHLDDFATDEFHPIVVPEDARIAHLVIIVDRE